MSVRRAGCALATVLALALASGCATAPRAPAPPEPGEAAVGSVEEGWASYYGRAHHGKKTASGERFDMNAMTAAHRRYPFGSLVRVTDVATGKDVVVEVNDRGPFTRDRIIDLSYAAAKALGILERGVARVRIERVK